MRQKRELTDTTGRLAEAVARLARLDAELDGSQTVTLPKELVQLEPFRVREIAAIQRAALDRSRQALIEGKSGLERLVALKQREAESYEREIVRIGQRINEQKKVVTLLEGLHQERVINQQRFFEAVTILDGLQRDKQGSVVGLSQANTEVEKARRELAQLTLANNARIAKEIVDTQFEITRLKRAAKQIGDDDTLAEESSSGPVATYKIMRRDAAGRPNFTQANEATAIMPGDVIEVTFIRKREGFF
jgi:epimerase transport system membrane fusion protein